MAVQVLQNFRWAAREVLPALCTLGLTWRVLRRPEVIACLLRTIACAVAVAAGPSLGWILWWEEREDKKNPNKPKKTKGKRGCCPRAGSRGGGTAVRHERCQIPSWQWNVSVVWGAKSSQWKAASLASVCLGPKDRENGVGRIKKKKEFQTHTQKQWRNQQLWRRLWIPSWGLHASWSWQWRIWEIKVPKGEALRGPVATETWVPKLPQQKRLFVSKGPGWIITESTRATTGVHTSMEH